MTQELLPFIHHNQMLNELEINSMALSDIVDGITKTYLSDSRPWIIGFSGGKDSTAILSLVYAALARLPLDQRHKHVYIVSSDTLVETPLVVDLIDSTLKIVESSAQQNQLPMTAHPVYPDEDQTFWVNLLGRGYPAPQQSFRWCTERMKIDPVSAFITSQVAQYGEVIVVLGSRRQESSSRSQVISKHRIKGSVLGRHTSLPNAYTYMPIENWSADDVWEYLMSAPTPWGGSNRNLFELYKGSNQGECPLVIDKSTPSCGNSRFGCWTCTVVTEDKALHGLIESGEEWMRPLLNFRNELYKSTDPAQKNNYRNYKRRTGKVSYQRAKQIDEEGTLEIKHIPGPYWMVQRQKWLRELLEIQKKIQDDGHEIELIRINELENIRQHWLRDPNEPDWTDALPKIYRDVYPDNAVDWVQNDAGAFTQPDAQILKALGEKYSLPAELIMKLIETEISVTGLGKRRGVTSKLETVLKQDWGSLEEINTLNQNQRQSSGWTEKIEELKNLYETAPE